MRLQKVSRTASAVSRAIAPARADARVEPVTPVDAVHERRRFMMRRRLPENAPDEPTERGTYLDLIV